MKNMFCNIIDEYLEKLLKYDEGSGLPRVVYEAMSYSVLGDGKRMRPTLLLGACNMLGGEIEAALPFAAAVELIHAYSLIHDDLPAMDNDDYRRGKPSCHKKFGEAIAILTGDALLSLAFEVMLKTFETSNSLESEASPKLTSRVEACRDIAVAAGPRGMVGGQAMEISLTRDRIESAKILDIHRLKTGALISASVLAGARIAEADELTLKLMQELGHKFGMAFQILDDLQDAQGDEINFAVTVGSDHAKELCERLTEEIGSILASLNLEGGFFYEYINSILYRR